MTATASDSAGEFNTFYQLSIVQIPPNRPMIREDKEDRPVRTKFEKEQAIIDEITAIRNTGRPILISTRSIEEYERLAARIEEQDLNCQVLYAKNDELEAKIIAIAGMLNAITISTNMAGRGTDIKLGADNQAEREKVRKLGGLFVLGTNKHESSRIDQQLIGRAGRQGDPGTSRFIISLEDELLLNMS